MLPDENRVRVVAIFGPTAVGKSRIAVEVAGATGGEIISADSMQIYRGLSILTDQPSPEMLAEVPHHLIGVVPLTEDYSAARYCREAQKVIGEVAERGSLPLLVGGTGLYVRALLGGLSFAGRSDTARRRWEEFVRDKGKGAAYDELRRLDPVAAAAVDRQNPRRLVRALEAAGSGGPSLVAERDRLWSPQSRYRVLSFGLEMNRDDLYSKIERRVDKMLSLGVVGEVRNALRAGVSITAEQAIGFSDIKDYVEGRMRIDLAGRTPARAAKEIIERIRLTGYIPDGTS
jgi:tRNA dimethylallyltransferase